MAFQMLLFSSDEDPASSQHLEKIVNLHKFGVHSDTGRKRVVLESRVIELNVHFVDNLPEQLEIRLWVTSNRGFTHFSPTQAILISSSLPIKLSFLLRF